LDPSPDSKVGLIAAGYFGFVTPEQLTTCGLARGAVAHRVKLGRLVVVYSGVYAVGHRRTDGIAVAAAAVLAGGPSAVLSHSSAAVLWGLRERWPARPEITVQRDRRPKGVRVHMSTTLTRRDITRHRRIRVTSPARTVLDNAPRLSDAALARVVNEGRRSRHLRLADLAEVVQRNPRHPGAKRLRPFIDAPTGPTRSEFEDAFVAFARRFDLPTPLINATVAGYEVDVLFPTEGLIVELDGYEFHGNRRSFETDRERDAATLAAGFPTVRVTWKRLTGAPAREATRLHKILAARRQSGMPAPRTADSRPSSGPSERR
jgi:hypothetical protein